MLPDALSADAAAAPKTRQLRKAGAFLRFREMAKHVETFSVGAVAAFIRKSGKFRENSLLPQLAKWWRFPARTVAIYRSLAIKIVLLSLIFLAVPIILYRLVQIFPTARRMLPHAEHAGGIG